MTCAEVELLKAIGDVGKAQRMAARVRRVFAGAGDKGVRDAADLHVVMSLQRVAELGAAYHAERMRASAIAVGIPADVADELYGGTRA